MNESLEDRAERVVRWASTWKTFPDDDHARYDLAYKAVKRRLRSSRKYTDYQLACFAAQVAEYRLWWMD